METTKTITTIFIVPIFSIGKEKLTNNGFVNGFIKDSRKDVQYKDSVYLLFKPEDLDKFKVFLDGEYERTKSIIDDYDYEEGYVVVVYQISARLLPDIELIKQGKYSKTSTKFQQIFPKTITIKKNGFQKDELSLQYRVFNKTEDLKQFWEDKFDVVFDDDMEVWSGFSEGYEILDLDKIKQHV
jgi:hypothetical protein